MSVKCGSEDALRDNIEKAMGREGIKAEVVFRRIGDKEAQALGLKGSPSVLVNGKDVDPQDISGFA